MTGKTSLISFSKAIDPTFRANDAKLCFLWFEGLIFEDLGAFGVDKFVDGLVDDRVKARDRHIIHDLSQPVSAVLERESIEDRLKTLQRGYPRWGGGLQNYDYPEPEDAYQFAHNQLLRTIEREKGVSSFAGYELEQVEGRARVAVDAVDMWDRVNAKSPCVLQATNDEDIAVKATRSFGNTSNISSISYQLFRNEIPSLAKVPWNEIIDLKFSRAFVDLKDKISDISLESNGDPVAAQESLNKSVMEAMDHIVEAHKPQTISVTIMSALGNIPVPGINPFGIFSSVRDVAKELKKRDDFQWLYMLRDLKRPRGNL